MVFRPVGNKVGLALLLITLQHLLSLSHAQTDDQVQALLSIKKQVGLSSTNLTSWNTTSQRPCLDKWFGVTCDNSSKIIALNLSSCSLQGPLHVDTFSKLTTLVSLDFFKNNLEGPLPNLTQLTSLQMLNFSMNVLREPFPTSIFSLKTLVVLSLGNNNLTGPIPEQISNLELLEELWLGNNPLKGPFPKGLASLTHLQIFTAWGSTLDAELPKEWGNWVNITYIWDANCFDDDNHTRRTCRSDLTCGEFSNEENRKNPPKPVNGPQESIPIPNKKKSFPSGAIAGVIVAAIVVLCVILGLLYWARPGASNSRRRRRKDQDAGDWKVPQGVRRLTYQEVSKATKSFDKSCEIGKGGFGKVYVAQLDDGKHVAIKRASDLSFQGTKAFQNEITLLSRLHHRHLVRLEGFCDDRDEQILVYEYMSNGNLHRHLFDKHASTLNWYRRLEIALAVAQGLDYLHTFADPPVIHRDVKPSNILLDDNMIAKVSDFGISKANLEMDTHVSTRPAGTAGYWDPEYFLRRQLTTASDVYGYGVVLLELITGQRAIDHKRLEDYNLVGWVKPKLVSNNIHAIIDPRLGSNFPAEQYQEVAHLAMGCAASERGDRPTMQTVASTLERILSSLVPPPEHLLSLTPPLLSPLMKGKDSSSQISSDVKTKFGFTDYTEVEPR